MRITDPWALVPPAPKDIRDHLLLLNSENEVTAASGTLSFTENRSGNPGGKHIPVLALPDSSDSTSGKPYITPHT
ncbi:hypothetical protein [Allosalinactinospora lopnorensis]|uniref:hypothetical protein n=1 Tax=Allosalinactinospora lopnorensis TaxID=1352348 RepID=UPI0012E2ACDD|nr:hypothetical protein [Allosalinactinospora lopnorensis]